MLTLSSTAVLAVLLAVHDCSSSRADASGRQLRSCRPPAPLADSSRIKMSSQDASNPFSYYNYSEGQALLG